MYGKRALADLKLSFQQTIAERERDLHQAREQNAKRVTEVEQQAAIEADRNQELQVRKGRCEIGKNVGLPSKYFLAVQIIFGPPLSIFGLKKVINMQEIIISEY